MDIRKIIREAVGEVLQEQGERAVYHGTSRGAANRIHSQGLKPGSFFSDDLEYAKTYASRKNGPVLRVIKTDDMQANPGVDPVDGSQEFISSRPLSPEQIEIFTKDGWVPLSSWDPIEGNYSLEEITGFTSNFRNGFAGIPREFPDTEDFDEFGQYTRTNL